MIRCRGKVRIDLHQNQRIKGHSKKIYSTDKELIHTPMVPNIQDNGKTTKCTVKGNMWMVQASYGQEISLMDCMIQAKLMYHYDPNHLVYEQGKSIDIDKEKHHLFVYSTNQAISDTDMRSSVAIC